MAPFRRWPSPAPTGCPRPGRAASPGAQPSAPRASGRAQGCARLLQVDRDGPDGLFVGPHHDRQHQYGQGDAGCERGSPVHRPDHYLVGEDPDHDRRHPAQHIRTEPERRDPPGPLEQEKSSQQAGRRSHDQGQADDPGAAGDSGRDAAPRQRTGSDRVDQEPEGQGRGATNDRVPTERDKGGGGGQKATTQTDLRRAVPDTAATRQGRFRRRRGE